MLWQQEVLVTILLEEFAGIDEEHTAVCLGTLLQNDDTGGNAYTKEQVSRQLDDAIYKVVLDGANTPAGA